MTFHCPIEGCPFPNDPNYSHPQSGGILAEPLCPHEWAENDGTDDLHQCDKPLGHSGPHLCSFCFSQDPA